MVTDEDSSSTSLTLANYLSKTSMGQEQSVLSAFHPETVSIKQETFNTNQVNWIKFIFLNSCSQVSAVVRRTMSGDFLRKSITWMDDEIPSRFNHSYWLSFVHSRSCCCVCGWRYCFFVLLSSLSLLLLFRYLPILVKKGQQLSSS